MAHGRDDLVTALLGSVADRDRVMVDRACVGLHWTAVRSDDGIGMSHTYKTARKDELRGSGELVGTGALEMAGRMHSWEPLEASLGVAALNSLIRARGRPGNVKDIILERAPGSTVTVIGRFPFNDQVRELSRRAHFLEMEPRKDELPSSAAEKVIPGSDLVVITATALINHTLQRLLELSENCYAIVLGPSTPMSDVLFDFGADALAGVRITDEETLFRTISHGVKTFKRIGGKEPVTLLKEG